MKNKYSQQEETSASVIFMGDSTNEKHDIKIHRIGRTYMEEIWKIPK